MSDEPFYAPNHEPTPTPRRRIPSEPLWEVRKDHVAWSCELRFHSESYGWAAMITCNGELSIGRR